MPATRPADPGVPDPEVPDPGLPDPRRPDLATDLVVTTARFVRSTSRRTGAATPRALWRTLSVIDELGPLRVTDLARADGTAQPTTTAAVQKLEAQGWVRRAPDPDDARATRVELTPAGLAHLSALRGGLAAQVQLHLDGFAPEELAVLERAVPLLRQMLADPSG